MDFKITLRIREYPNSIRVWRTNHNLKNAHYYRSKGVNVNHLVNNLKLANPMATIIVNDEVVQEVQNPRITKKTPLFIFKEEFGQVKTKDFKSQSEAARYLHVTYQAVNYALRTKGKVRGWYAEKQ